MEITDKIHVHTCLGKKATPSWDGSTDLSLAAFDFHNLCNDFLHTFKERGFF